MSQQPHQRYLQADVVSHVANLEMRAREIVEGLLSGRHRSPHFGHSVEFAQHREYVRGDEIRFIDWKVWGKNDRYVVKQFEDETNLRTTLLVDCSESMDYGQGEQQKFEYSCTLAAVLAYLLLRQADSVGLVAFDDQVRHEVGHSSSKRHLHALLHAMHLEKPTKKTDMLSILRRVTDRDAKRGMMVLISDLLVDPEDTIRGLKLLRQRRHDVIVFHVLHDDEMEFNFEGNTRFDGLESEAFVNCDPRSLRDGYLEALNKYLDTLRRRANQAGVDYRLVRTSQSIGAILAALLHQRSKG